MQIQPAHADNIALRVRANPTINGLLEAIVAKNPQLGAATPADIRQMMTPKQMNQLIQPYLKVVWRWESVVIHTTAEPDLELWIK